MANAVAVVLPDWLKSIKCLVTQSDQKIYRFLPALMQWRSEEYMVKILLEHTCNAALKEYMEETFEELHAYAGKPPDVPHPLIARITLWSHLPKKLFLEFANDAKKPKACTRYVLRIGDSGLIEEISLS